MCLQIVINLDNILQTFAIQSKQPKIGMIDVIKNYRSDQE
jgi:hypothetical protein